MKKYIGVKLVLASEMSRADYNALRGWTVPADENPADEGYLVEYLDGGKPNHPDFTGYISWSPKKQFEDAYRTTTGLTFGLAIEALKKGLRVARTGWNGKGMWLSLSCLSEGNIPLGRSVPASAFWSKNNADYARECRGGHATVLPCITMKTATGEILMGWLASQTDMLAVDWLVVE